MHERLAVYVPNEDAPELVGLVLKHIDKGSGIVGVPVEDSRRAPRTLIYFEGGRYASNIVTLADRCYLAASRLTEKYPTSAMAEVLTEGLTQAGWFYPRYKRVEVRDVHDLIALAHWLDLDVSDDRLRHELHPQGVAR